MTAEPPRLRSQNSDPSLSAIHSVETDRRLGFVAAYTATTRPRRPHERAGATSDGPRPPRPWPSTANELARKPQGLHTRPLPRFERRPRRRGGRLPPRLASRRDAWRAV